MKIKSVFGHSFERYGKVLTGYDVKELLSKLDSTTEKPKDKVIYTPGDAGLESLPVAKQFSTNAYGGMPIQAGFCNGRGSALNAEEYHKCSEVNYSTTGLVLLLALPGDVHDRILDSRDVRGFYLPPHTLIEIHPRVLHFAPCRIKDSGFNCLVVLERGTNEPLDSVDPSAPGEEGLLWMRNKWLLCHPDSPQAQKGAFVGIAGENLTLRI
jgi:hypothetical protein